MKYNGKPLLMQCNSIRTRQRYSFTTAFFSAFRFSINCNSLHQFRKIIKNNVYIPYQLQNISELVYRDNEYELTLSDYNIYYGRIKYLCNEHRVPRFKSLLQRRQIF